MELYYHFIKMIGGPVISLISLHFRVKKSGNIWHGYHRVHQYLIKCHCDTTDYSDETI